MVTTPEELFERLDVLGVRPDCPRCGSGSWSADTTSLNTFDQPRRQRAEDDRHLAKVAIFCNRCGFVSEHAAGVLGLV
jgi:ribosomal protein S27AE